MHPVYLYETMPFLRPGDKDVTQPVTSKEFWGPVGKVLNLSPRILTTKGRRCWSALDHTAHLKPPETCNAPFLRENLSLIVKRFSK